MPERPKLFFSASQTIANWSAGIYRISFLAAQRANIQASSEDFVVTFDGILVGSFRPSGTSYAAYQTGILFTAGPGPHTIAFIGLNSNGGDNSAFIDDVRVLLVAPFNGTANTAVWTAYDGANPYADFDAAGALTNRYTYGPAVDMILARIWG